MNEAFVNFYLVLNDFQEQFRKYAEPFGEDMLITRKIYHIDRWDPALYDRLSKKYSFHVDLVEDLMLELSRAANLICDRVRQHIMLAYRLDKGHLVVDSGPHSDLGWQSSVPTYSQEERNRTPPYPGLEAFLVQRAERDLYFGKGTDST